MIAALRYVRRRIGRPLVLVWDQPSAHTAQPVQAFLARHRMDFAVEWLPSYAPDLNPEEWCHGAVKEAMRNAVPTSIDELRNQARWGFVRLGRRSEGLRGFFHHAGLDVT